MSEASKKRQRPMRGAAPSLQRCGVLIWWDGRSQRTADDREVAYIYCVVRVCWLSAVCCGRLEYTSIKIPYYTSTDRSLCWFPHQPHRCLRQSHNQEIISIKRRPGRKDKQENHSTESPEKESECSICTATRKNTEIPPDTSIPTTAPAHRKYQPSTSSSDFILPLSSPPSLSSLFIYYSASLVFADLRLSMNGCISLA
ncbi:hypothetical protein BJX96DRAFT_33064 [Aspergillus floccosus]